MAQRRHPKRGRGRTTPKGTPPAGVHRRRSAPGDAGAVPDLVAGILPLLAAPTAFDLLSTASGFVEIVTERPLDQLGPGRVDKVDGPDFLGSLLRPEWPELAVLGRAMATLLPDRPMVRQLREQPLPPGAPAWASTMGSIEVTGTYAQTEPLGDGVNMWVCVRWPDGSDATVVLFIDHNMGTLLKDGFLIPAGAAEVMSTMREVADDFIDIEPADPADLRARFAWSLDRSEHTLPPPESETWPACRPLVEWIVGHLPTGGNGWDFGAWSDAQRHRLVSDFVGSPFGRRCLPTADVVRMLAENFVRHGCDYGSGDPLRWSPIVVEIVLTDWFPRKVFGLTDTEVDAVPEVLEQFIAFAHDRTGVDPDTTRMTLSTIVLWEDDFVAAMARQPHLEFGTGRRAGEMAGESDDSPLLRAILGDQASENYMDGVTDELEQRVIALVGGRAAYDALDDEPLGDIEFDWSRVPAEMTDLTLNTLELVDAWSAEHFDGEVRSIARVTLGAVVATDRSVFRRSARTDVLAAAILGATIRRLSDRFDRKEKAALGWAATSVSRLAELVGLTPATVGARVKTVLNVLDRADVDWSVCLHSTQRRTALESKQNIADYRSRTVDWP